MTKQNRDSRVVERAPKIAAVPAALYAVVNHGGEIAEITSPTEASVPRVGVFDRGFLYGDSLYEVMRTYGGKLFGVEEHLERLEESAALCRMTLNPGREVLAREITRTVERYHQALGDPRAEAYCRLIVTRGTGKIGFSLSYLQTACEVVVIVQALKPPTHEEFERGLSLQVSSRIRNDRRALDPAMKSGNYLNSLLAFLEAEAEGYDDALLCDGQGFLTEGTTFNLFYVRSGIVATPPLDVGILDGITRRWVLEICRELGIEAREVRFPRERLYDADEVFISSTIREVMPVTRLDGRGVSGGTAGAITRRLAEAFRTRVAQAVARA